MRLVAWIAVPLVFVASAARADDNSLRLTWKAPAGCPSVDDVRSATLRDANVATAARAVLEADAEVEERELAPSEGRFRVHLRTRRGAVTGEREIEAASCNGVADATAVVLALALVPTADEPEPAPPAPPAAERRTAPPAAPPEPPPEGPHAFALGIGAAADMSTLPSPAVGGSLTLAWTPGRLRIEADARRWIAQSHAVPDSATGARFSMTSLGGRGCMTVLRSVSVELSPCGGADVHLVSAPGFGAHKNYSANAAWVTVTGGALLRVSLASWLAMRGRLDALVPLTRPTFFVENEGSLHRSPALGVAGTFGVEALFL